MLEAFLKAMKIKYFIVDKNNNIIPMDGTDPDFLFKVYNKGQADGDIFKYGESYYQFGKAEEEFRTIYFLQDVTELVEKYIHYQRDELTKLYLRSVAFPLIEEYLVHASLNDERYSVIMGDIDFFKAVNDKYGHDKGDEVLERVAYILLNSFRTRDNIKALDGTNQRREQPRQPKDVICRFGGEEFLILLKNISLEDSLKRIDQVRNLIQENVGVTMSFGLAHVNTVGEPLFSIGAETERERLVKIADDCLYHSKHNGRNVVSYYDNGEIKLYKPDEKRLVKEDCK